jgi:co-chaperonin GroES (HSP10)
MRATFRNVIVKELVDENKSTGGIFLGETKDNKFSRGEVVCVGDEVKHVEENDVIWFDKFRGSPINYKGIEYMVITYENVVIVEDKI